MSWKEYTIGELCIKVTDGSHFSPKELTEGYPMFSVKDMTENGFDYSDVKRVSKEDYLKLERGDCKPKKGDVLIAKDGSYLKHVFVCKEEKEEAILSSIAILRPDKNKIETEYFMHLLRTPSIKGMMESFVSGSALPRIVLKDFKKMKLSIPEPKTQQRIASILSAYDDLIEVNNQRIKLLEETARELYKEWFVRMRFPGYKKAKFVKGVPEGWEVKKVKDIVDRRKFGKTYRPEELSEQGNVIVIDQSTNALLGFHNNNPDHLATSESPMIIFGDHTCKMQLMIQPFSLAENVIPIAAKDKIPIYYLYYLIESLVETTEYKRHWNDLVTKSVFVCQPLLRMKYAEIVKPFFEQIEILKQQNTQLRQIRDRLLPRLISGKLEVKDLKQNLNQDVKS